MTKDYSKEIAAFKHSAEVVTLTPAEWMKLWNACLDKFGEKEGTKKFKDWQRGKFIQFKPYVQNTV